MVIINGSTGRLYNLDGGPAGSGPGPLEIAPSWPGLIRPCIIKVTTQEEEPSQALTLTLRRSKHVFSLYFIQQQKCKVYLYKPLTSFLLII